MTREKIVAELKQGKVGVLPTDTLYGLVGSALRADVVERIYGLRSRNPDKPMIILISDVSDLKNFFGISLSAISHKLFSHLWPGKVSIILPCRAQRFRYLHRGIGALAFRVPENKWLRDILRKAGPLVSPSANPESRAPAKTVGEAKKYFGRSVDFYCNRGKLDSKPSTLIKIKGGKIEVIRQGVVKINNKINKKT
jgi:L-threonylcarbamoyladenylate synthase